VGLKNNVDFWDFELEEMKYLDLWYLPEAFSKNNQLKPGKKPDIDFRLSLGEPLILGCRSTC
jgi:hypothetical protein